MFSNYLRVFLQNVRRNPVFSSLNIIGLSLGMGISLLIAMFAIDELSFDKFHDDSDRMYRVGIKGILAGNEFNGVTSCAPMSAALNTEVPGIELSTRISQWPTLNFHLNGEVLAEDEVLLGDPNFFEFFDFQLIAGDKETALEGKNKIVLTESTVTKFFGNLDHKEVVGKLLKVGNDEESFQVTGVAADPPKNSHIQFPLIMSMETWDYSASKQWTSNSLHTYFKVTPNVDLATIQEQFDRLVEKYVGPEVQQYIGLSLAEFKEQGGDYGYWFQSIEDIHLHSNYEGEISANGDMQNVLIFITVGLFVLIIAGINFINLATARASDRAKEVGIRKSIGAHKQQLIYQYLFESFGYCLVAAIIAIVGVLLLLEPFNQITNKTFEITDVLNIQYMGSYFVFILIVSLLAGVYPSFVLSAYEPVAILKGLATKQSHHKLTPRNLMVGFQFALTAVAIILTIAVFKQLDMMRNRNLGFEKERVVVLNNAHTLPSRVGFKHELLAMPEVTEVNLTTGYPPQIGNNSVYRVADTQDDILFYNYDSDVDHLKTFQFKLTEGRFFEDAALDKNSIVMNEAAYKMTGWTDLEGKQIIEFGDEGEDNILYNVVGVVKDFQFQDFKTSVQPLIIFSNDSIGRYMALKLNSDNMISTMNEIKSKWMERSNGKPFDYAFVDDQFERLFETEKRLGELTSILTILTIITASLGLFGLAAFVARSRRKEFSIRKVLGATVSKVMALQFYYFLTISLISMFVAIPVSYFLVNQWLQEFEYRIANDWTLYSLTFLAVLVLVIVTVSYQAYRVSTLSPTKVLREE